MRSLFNEKPARSGCRPRKSDGAVATNRERTAMKVFARSLKRFLASEDGPTAVEYAVMLALIIVVCIGTVTTIGTKANAKFQSTAAVL